MFIWLFIANKNTFAFNKLKYKIIYIVSNKIIPDNF